MKVTVTCEAQGDILDVYRITYVPIPNGDMDKAIELVASVEGNSSALVQCREEQELIISKRLK